MITIRKATPADKYSIWSVRTRAIKETCESHYTAQEIDTWSSAPMRDDFDEVIDTTDFLVAEDESLIVGTGFLTQQLSQIDAIFVRPDYQRRGIGRQLLAALEKIARDAGLRVLRLSSTLNAAEFYQSAGYQVQRRGKYTLASGLALDCVSMEKVLDRRAGAAAPHD